MKRGKADDRCGLPDLMIPCPDVWRRISSRRRMFRSGRAFIDDSDDDIFGQEASPRPTPSIKEMGSTTSLLSVLRSRTPPQTPLLFSNSISFEPEGDALADCPLLPHLGKLPKLRMITNGSYERRPLRIGVIFAGRQGSGGHNVLAGVRDYILLRNSGSQVFAFYRDLGDYWEVTAEHIDPLRNAGGSAVLAPLDTAPNPPCALKLTQKLDLHGIVIIGGERACRDAATIADYFKSEKCGAAIVAVAKATGGDLPIIEVSPGFDTAVRTYAEFVGNLETDVATSGKYYHCVRVLGSRSSHVAVHVACMARPNYVAVGEEFRGKPFSDLLDELQDLVIRRSEIGKNHGVLLFPEGLLNFFPEFTAFIAELKAGARLESLSPASKALWETIPEPAQPLFIRKVDKLTLSSFPVERLVAAMLEARVSSTIDFRPRCHSLAREGRAAFPSPFECSYTYALGFTAAALIEHKHSGYMATVSRLDLSPESWSCGGYPLTAMCEADAGQPKVPRRLVDVDSEDYKIFTQARSIWKLRDCYVSPGPIQFDGATSEEGPVALRPMVLDDLVPDIGYNWVFRERRHFFPKSDEQLSPLQRARLSARVPRPGVLGRPCEFVFRNKVAYPDPQTEACVSTSYARQCQLNKSAVYDLIPCANPSYYSNSSNAKPPRVGVLLNGQQAAGVNNVLVGLWEGLTSHLPRGYLFGFVGGVKGLLEKPIRAIELTREDIDMCRNQGGFEILGRQKEAELLLGTEAGVERVVNVLTEELQLDYLVLIGGRHTITCGAILTEEFLARKVKTKLVIVPATQNNNVSLNLLECCLGFDSSAKCYGQLIGNLNSDSLSNERYWSFVRLMGMDKSHLALETALSTHSNVTLISEYITSGQNSTLIDVINNLTDAVVARMQKNKPFGTALIPEGLISSLPEFNLLFLELKRILTTVKTTEPEQFTQIIQELSRKEPNNEGLGLARAQLSPFTWNLWQSLPHYIRRQLLQPKDLGCLELTKVSTEELISDLVHRELERRVTKQIIPQSYVDNFQPLCFYYGYSCRGTLPSVFDCALGWAHGAIAAELVKANITGYVTAPRGLSAKPRDWICRAYPCTAFLKPRSFIMEQDILPRPMPAVPGDRVSTNSASLKAFLEAKGNWLLEEQYIVPGPLQFYNEAGQELNRLLEYDHRTYLEMLRKVHEALSVIRRICGSGPSETILSVTVGTLSSLRQIIKAAIN